ncbi:methyltransferase domain-containing protein [Ditylenchus destructor]|nr:methyltransferase domain-containing protein [Ditylenchus destructor]
MSDAKETEPKIELPKSPDDAFAMRMMNVACNALLSGAINLGIDLGLFEALAKAGNKTQPATAADVAKISGTKERYCQEWLCSMACGDVIEMDETGKNFWILEERVSMMTGPNPHIGFMMNMALSAYGASYKQLCNVIKQDGPLGMNYSDYGELYKKINFMSRAMHQKHLVKDLVPTLGMKELLSSGIKVLDVGCGSGFHAMELASHFPNSHFTGVDLGDEGIKNAQKEAAEKELKNTSFICANANKLDASWTDKFDLVLIFDACHDQTRPDLTLREINRCLKSDGLFAMIEVNGTGNCFTDKAKLGPVAGAMYGASLFHCLPVGSNTPDALQLGSMWGQEKAKSLIEAAGFKNVEIEEIPFYQFNILYKAKK